jgi:hypothetical protein
MAPKKDVPRTVDRIALAAVISVVLRARSGLPLAGQFC